MWIWLLLALLVFAPMFSDVSGQSIQGNAIIFSKKGGTPCGEDDKCVENATCDDDTDCTCQDHGNGRFHCYRPDQIRFQMIEDKFWPTSKDGTGYSFPYSKQGVYRFINVKTNGTGAFSTCNLQVKGIIVLSQDTKTVIGGVELRLDVVSTKGDKHNVSVRLTGSRKSNVFRTRSTTFDGSGSGDGGVVSFSSFVDDEDLAPANGQWTECHSFFIGNDVERKVKENIDNFAVIDLMNQCGTIVKLLASDTTGVTDDLSGLAIIMETANGPEFPSGGYLNEFSDTSRRKRQAVSAMDNVFLFVMTYGAATDHTPDQGKAITDTINTYHSLCQLHGHTAIVQCSTILHHDLLSCMDSQRHSTGISTRAWALVNQCLRYVCTSARSSCYLMYQQLHTLGCAAKHWNWIRSTLDCPSDSHRPPHK